MNKSDYRSFVNKVATGLVTLTDAQKANPRIIEAAWQARQSIEEHAKAEATRKAQAQSQSDRLPK